MLSAAGKRIATHTSYETNSICINLQLTLLLLHTSLCTRQIWWHTASRWLASLCKRLTFNFSLFLLNLLQTDGILGKFYDRITQNFTRTHRLKANLGLKALERFWEWKMFVAVNKMQLFASLFLDEFGWSN